MREWLFVSTVVVLLAAPRLWALPATPFQLGEQGGVIVPVMLNGSGPFRMLLDTGATHSTITERVAAALSAPAVARSTVISPTGPQDRAVVVIERLEIGPVDAGMILASLAPSRSFDRDGRIDGIVGQDVLAGLRYTIDFVRREVRWHDRAPVAHGVALPLQFDHGRFLVNLPQPGNHVLRLVPDSGAGALVLFNTAAPGRTVGLTAAGGRADARELRLKRLCVGGRTLFDVPAVAVERPDLHPAEGDGLLPLHLFERVTFDGPRRVMFVG